MQSSGAKGGGRETVIRCVSGAFAVREVRSARSVVAEHCHDWPSLIISLVGDFTSAFEGGERRLKGPAAVLHPAGGHHAATIGRMGLEAVTIQFDPAWTRCAGFDGVIDRNHAWCGGAAASAAQRLARRWINVDEPDKALADQTAEFLRIASAASRKEVPLWIRRVQERLGVGETFTARQIAIETGLHPSWIAQTYRLHIGEGMQESARRYRLQRASFMLRHSILPLAEIAVASGFSDQPHMNRSFRKVLGRTPLEVRDEE